MSTSKAPFYLTNMAGHSREEGHGRVDSDSVDVQLGRSSKQIAKTIDVDPCLALSVVVYFTK